MGRFEEYGLYQENRRFLSSEQVITFTDLDGRLLALKPDVTLSIAKNAQVEQGGCGRFYYSENVYRPSQESHTFREISQMGLECIGAVDDEVTAQTVALALQSLAVTERDYVLELSHMGFVTGLLDAVGAPESIRPRLLNCIRDRNAHELQKCAAEAGLSRQGTDALRKLNTLSGGWEAVLAEAERLAREAGYCSLGIHTTQDNLPAQNLYTACGYTLAESGPCTTADGVERIGYTFCKNL
jgi:ATP phosphoribosyltransferase regulatory subunit